MKDDMITSAGGAPPRTDAAASDAAEVLTIHAAWFASAVGLDVERMRPNYVSGPHMRMYNTDGHTYIGVEELVRSWEAGHGTMDVHVCEDVSEPVEVTGDIAWLVVDQAEMRCRALWPEGHGASTMEPLDEAGGEIICRFRGTEVYNRDDRAGNASWKLGHGHCAVRAPDGDVHSSAP